MSHLIFILSRGEGDHMRKFLRYWGVAIILFALFTPTMTDTACALWAIAGAIMVAASTNEKEG